MAPIWCSGDAQFVHSLLNVGISDVRPFVSKLDSAFRQVCGDRRAAGRRGADHRRRLLAPQLAGDAFLSFAEAVNESLQVAWRFHGEPIPRIHTPRKSESARETILF